MESPETPRYWSGNGGVQAQKLEADPNERATGFWREKQTDIKLAIQAVTDAIQTGAAGHVSLKGYDTAIILSGDLDFLPLAQVLTRPPFGKRVRILLPPNAPDIEGEIQRSWGYASEVLQNQSDLNQVQANLGHDVPEKGKTKLPGGGAEEQT